MKRGPYKGKKHLLQHAVNLRIGGFGYHRIGKELNVHWRTIAGWVKAVKVDRAFCHSVGMKYQGERRLLNLEQCKTDRSRKRALIRERGHRCQGCGLNEWLGNKIPLELEHVDGNDKNCAKKNLKLLCPNCHALTPTYKGKNIKLWRGSNGKTKVRVRASIPTAEEVGSNPIQSQFKSEDAHQSSLKFSGGVGKLANPPLC